MGWWTDIATPKYGCPNVGGRMTQQRGLVLHIAQGSYNGTISWQMNPSSQVSSHFVVGKSGQITQMVDTDYTAWTQSDGNGKWLSVENEGYVPDGLTEAQLDANAKLFARGAAEYGYPLQNTSSPDGYGLGHHSMGAECGQNWGHSECPGTTIKNQKPTIVDRAKGDDVPAQDVWGYDIDPSSNRYSAGGAVWTTYGRTDYLANNFAPEVLARLDALAGTKTVTATAELTVRDPQVRQLLIGQIVVSGLILVLLIYAVVAGTALFN